MQHLVLVVSLAALLAPARIAAAHMEVTAGIADSSMHQEAVRTRPRRVRPEPQAPIAENPGNQTPSTGSATVPVIAADGAVETVMPDGSTRRARPGDCGWTIVHPDGTKNAVACIHVPRADLPVPDDKSAAWLTAHGDTLLGIARGLLGSNAASIDNYLKTVESEQLGVYDRIRLRTDLISKLMAQ